MLSATKLRDLAMLAAAKVRNPFMVLTAKVWNLFVLPATEKWNFPVTTTLHGGAFDVFSPDSEGRREVAHGEH